MKLDDEGRSGPGRPARVRVMVSSRTKELAAERAALVAVIEAMGCEPLVWEGIPATGRNPEEESLRLATNCHIYVLLVAETYADIVVKEYSKAKERLREEILVFIKNGPHDTRTSEFVASLDRLHTRNTFDGVADLAAKVRGAILGVFEDALVERQGKPPRERYGTLWDETFVLGYGRANGCKFMALRGDQTSGVAEGNDNFDVDLVDEENYANMKARKRYDPIIHEKNRSATNLASTIPHDGFYYLWIETYALGKTTIKVEFRRQLKAVRQARST